MKAPVPRLLLITNRKICLDLEASLAAALAGGVRHILLREKDLPTDQLISLARRIRQQTDPVGAFLLISERIDVALCVKAAGVHLPQAAISTQSAKEALGPEMLVGRSCHDAESAQKAQAVGVDYLTLSPLFATCTHPGKKPIGLDQFAKIRKNVQGPVLALGGIGLHNVRDALATGADGVALIRGILDQHNPRNAAEDMLRIMAGTNPSIRNEND